MTRADLSIREATPSDRKAWDDIASHPLQSWAWGKFRQAMGIDVVRLGVVQGEGARPELVEGWQLTFHRVPHTPWTIGYFPKGPAPGTVMVDELTKLGRQKKAIFIQLEPNILTTHQLAINTCQLIPSHHPLFTKYTFVLNLTKSEDELLAAMHPKTRYNIKIAQKHGVIVKEDNSKNAFDEYLRLTSETSKRQAFYAHNQAYHREMWQIMRRANIAHLWTAAYEQNILAAWIVFVWKNTIYYPYGASSRRYREVMAPNLLLWEICRWAKVHNLKYFDLWGALGLDPDPNDPWFGFHRFKAGYNPTLIEFIGSFDLVINPLLYKIYKAADALRWTYLKLRRFLP